MCACLVRVVRAVVGFCCCSCCTCTPVSIHSVSQSAVPPQEHTRHACKYSRALRGKKIAFSSILMLCPTPPQTLSSHALSSALPTTSRGCLCVWSALPLLTRSIRETEGRQLLGVSGRGDVRRGGKGAETGGETGERGRGKARGEASGEVSEGRSERERREGSIEALRPPPAPSTRTHVPRKTHDLLPRGDDAQPSGTLWGTCEAIAVPRGGHLAAPESDRIDTLCKHTSKQDPRPFNADARAAQDTWHSPRGDGAQPSGTLWGTCEAIAVSRGGHLTAPKTPRATENRRSASTQASRVALTVLAATFVLDRNKHVFFRHN